MTPLRSVAVLPDPDDNCAVALRLLAAGTRISQSGRSLVLAHDVPEGHRFTVHPVPSGGPLTSWGFPFGIAKSSLDTGCYVCNTLMLEELDYISGLNSRPAEANFTDWVEAIEPDDSGWRLSEPLPRDPVQENFDGFPRGKGRGTGTRNHLVVLGISSRVSSFARILAERLRSGAPPAGGFDGVVAVAHSEGGGEDSPRNRELVLRTLAGWILHPNVGAVLLVEAGGEPIGVADVLTTLEARSEAVGCGRDDWPPLGGLNTRGDFLAPLESGLRQAVPWIGMLRDTRRVACPASELRIALQCGGSDAFSGISANPLIGAVADRIIRQGGGANLAETPELAGAERYILGRVRDPETARRFLQAIAGFRRWMLRHGHTPEGNPSAGNRRRGLYNITLKSLGAATKKSPRVRLEEVVDYGESPTRQGYFFMNSPGNDLESLAGQVAAGCNLILFTTGSGSVTNFPFVPTLKFMSTSGRFRMLDRDMDVNAGRYLDGESMECLSDEAYSLVLRTASGGRTCGERAGHSQVSIWRDWSLGDPGLRMPGTSGAVGPTLREPVRVDWVPDAVGTPDPIAGPAPTLTCDLILPTSLCSGQVADAAARRLRVDRLTAGDPRRVVALPHTEGCGSTGGASQDLFESILIGHLTHPLVNRGVLLEHGCEKVHNQRLRRLLSVAGIDPDRFGWFGVQTDGGFETVLEKIAGWFSTPGPEPAPISAPAVALTSTGPPPPADFVNLLLDSMATRQPVLIPEWDPLGFVLEAAAGPRDTVHELPFASPPPGPGMYRVRGVSRHWVETMTGLAAAGCMAMIALHGDRPRQGLPLVPLIRCGWGECRSSELDVVLGGPADDWPERVRSVLEEVLAGARTVRCWQTGDVDFQVPRGPVGISV